MEGDKRNRRGNMNVLLIILGLFLFSDSNCFAQVYKYVDKEGAIRFTDTPPSSLLKDAVSNEEPKTKEIAFQTKRSRSEIKDILQLGQEILEEELAKPPEKQNRALIQELGIALYGDVSKHKIK
jgi:hypothetical protein